MITATFWWSLMRIEAVAGLRSAGGFFVPLARPRGLTHALAPIDRRIPPVFLESWRARLGRRALGVCGGFADWDFFCFRDLRFEREN